MSFNTFKISLLSLSRILLGTTFSGTWISFQCKDKALLFSGYKQNIQQTRVAQSGICIFSP